MNHLTFKLHVYVITHVYEITLSGGGLHGAIAR